MPILMYHGICDSGNKTKIERGGTSIATFRRQMEHLAAEGYKTLRLIDVIARLAEGTSFKSKEVVITFDDGLRSFYLRALPVLAQQGFTATLFVPTSFIGYRRSSFQEQECLTWHEVRETSKCGMEIGSHTVNHRRLMGLTWKEIEGELRQSRGALEEQLGSPVVSFAYPYAFPTCERFARRLRELLVECGYACCVTTEIGRISIGDDPYRLKRLSVSSSHSLSLFDAKVRGHLDWLFWLQFFAKRAKAIL